MIRDLSETLQAILSDQSLAVNFPELAKAQIAFDRPDENFKPTQSTIDLFLFDVRENMELKSNEPVIERKNGQALIHQGPLRVACTYLATAWPVNGPDLALQEQRLLAQVLQVLSSYPNIPDPFLKGKLAGQQPPLPMTASYPDEIKNPAEFWTAIGNKLRPCLSVTVTIAMEVFAPTGAPITKTEMLRLGERTGPDEEKLIQTTQEEFYRIGGRVTSVGTGVGGAMITLVGTGLAARTDADGFYVLGVAQKGPYVLQVQSGATTKQANVTIPAVAGSNYDVQL
jgi:hypothetical protein